MKKKAYVTIALFIVLAFSLSSTLFAFDSLRETTSESYPEFWNNVMSFYDEFPETVIKHPESPEDNIGPKNDESEIHRRGHRIRKPSAERTDKKFVETDN